MRGTITRVLHAKGFGFLSGEDDGQPRFFNASDLVQTDFLDLRSGMRVEFTPVEKREKTSGPRDNGLRAKEVCVL